MHPTLGYEIIKARIADWQRQAEQRTITHAALEANRTLTPKRPHGAARLTRRVLALLAIGERGVPARSRPLPACIPPARCNACG